MVLIFAKNLTSSFPFCFNIFLLLLYLHFNILLLLSYFLYLLYTVNQFSFTHFRYCVSIFSYKHMPQCKFSLYLKKAGLASRNIVHFLKKSHSTLYRSLLSLSSLKFKHSCGANKFLFHFIAAEVEGARRSRTVLLLVSPIKPTMRLIGRIQ